MERQVWWLATVVFTGAGLSFIILVPRTIFKVLGGVLIAVPHIIGAPEPDVVGGLVPTELEHAFVYHVLLTSAGFWLLLGALTGFLFKRAGAQKAVAQ